MICIINDAKLVYCLIVQLLAILKTSLIVSKGDDLLEAEVRMPEGIEIGRSLLVEFAGTPNLVPFVEKACAEAKKKMETRMVIPGLVEFGTFVMLSYLIMSSSVSVQKGADGKTTWKFGKKASSPEFVKAFLTKLTNIASRAALTN